jgi:hypothetical protein
MIEAALDRLLTAETTLIEALDGHDAAALESATLALADAVKDVRMLAPSSNTLGLLEQVRHALALAESARARVNYLTDRNRRRLELLSAAVGAERRTPAYGPDGRIRG